MKIMTNKGNRVGGICHNIQNGGRRYAMRAKKSIVAVVLCTQSCTYWVSMCAREISVITLKND